MHLLHSFRFLARPFVCCRDVLVRLAVCGSQSPDVGAAAAAAGKSGEKGKAPAKPAAAPAPAGGSPPKKGGAGNRFCALQP